MKILWLASWYPSKLKPFDGDFISRHAKAASYYNDIYLVHIVKDLSGTVTRSHKVQYKKEGRLTEIIIYYYSPFSRLIGKLISEWKYRYLFKKQINELLKQEGKPDIVHLHIGMKAGTIAQWVARKYNIPYLLTEHWTGFLPEAKPSFKNLPLYFQSRYRNIIKNASSISVVSKYLENNIKNIYPNENTVIIPNVLDTSLFKPGHKNVSNRIKFIHISNLTFQKNVESIIDAINILVDEGCDIQLDIIGPENIKLITKSISLGLIDNIKFHSEKPQADLIAFINQADAMILYSRYETFGCVAIEANGCGVPVIASDIPVLHEIIKEGFNGEFSPPDNPSSLASTLKKFISTMHNFNREEISTHAHKTYNYSKIGKQFDNWYRKHIGASDLNDN